jgi:hypothetical protein
LIRPNKPVLNFLMVVLLALVTVVGCSNINWGRDNGEQAGIPAIPETLFGMHLHRVATTGTFESDRNIKNLSPWPTVPFATWRLMAAYVEWFELEPAQGQWNFEILDKSVALAEENNVEILLPLGLTPRWASARPDERSVYGPGKAAEPKNIEDWRNYVRTVATRYKGRIRYYELWNEANWNDFFTGTIEKMLELSREAYQVLKEVDPDIVVVSPSAANLAFKGNQGLIWLDEYLAKGGGDYADVIGYHFYINVHPPERFVPVIRQAREIMAKYGQGDKPLWNTEAGWLGNQPVRSDEQASAFVARAYILHWDAGVSRFYWYSWDNRGTTVPMVEADRATPTPAAIAYGETYKWLVGARMSPCTTNAEKTWTCKLNRDGGYTGWIVWNPERQVTFEFPEDWEVRQARDLNGGNRNWRERKIEIGPSPLLLENTAS